MRGVVLLLWCQQVAAADEKVSFGFVRGPKELSVVSLLKR